MKRWLMLSCALLWLVGCGQPGNLYLPESSVCPQSPGNDHA